MAKKTKEDTQVIMLKGLGPCGTITYNDKMYENGAVLEVNTDVAEIYVKAGLAVIPKNDNEVRVYQDFLAREAARESRILAKIGTKGDTLK